VRCSCSVIVGRDLLLYRLQDHCINSRRCSQGVDVCGALEEAIDATDLRREEVDTLAGCVIHTSISDRACSDTLGDGRIAERSQVWLVDQLKVTVYSVGELQAVHILCDDSTIVGRTCVVLGDSCNCCCGC